MTTAPAHQPEMEDDLAWDIAKLFPRQGQWTAEQYLDVAMGTNRLVELVDGRLEVQPSPSLTHQRILFFLAEQLKAFVTAHGLGEVIIAGYPVRLGELTFREPDVPFISDASSGEMREQYAMRVDLAMEIVSPSNRKNDYEVKRDEYARNGVPEYWIIDPQARIVIVHRLEDDSYTEAGRYTAGGRAASIELAGFELEVTAVFAAGEGKA